MHDLPSPWRGAVDGRLHSNSIVVKFGHARADPPHVRAHMLGPPARAPEDNQRFLLRAPH
eukprot:3561142-Pyramimonas_sp.AAC.1